MKAHAIAQLIAVCVTAGFLLTGCSVVTTRQPLTAHPKAVDREKFEGVWSVGQDALTARFSADGILRVAGVEWQDDRFRLVEMELIVTEGKERNFLSVRYQEDGEWAEGYVLCQYAFTHQGDLIIWQPDVDVFEEAIRSERLEGSVEKSRYSTTVTVTNPPDALLRFIDQPQDLRLFHYTEPMVLRKLIDRDDAEK